MWMRWGHTLFLQLQETLPAQKGGLLVDFAAGNRTWVIVSWTCSHDRYLQRPGEAAASRDVAS